MTWTLMVHGGAGRIDRDVLTPGMDAGARAGLAQALDAGAALLAAGGEALDAVQAAVEVLEDDPHFNAGRGAVLTFDGMIEHDAAIMDGRDRNAGAVAGIAGTRHPVALARAVMEHSPHVFLAGAGANIFSREQGVEQIDPDWFVLPERRAQLAKMKADKDWFDVDMKYGTVGAVARDAAGHVAAATSTGGVTGKRWGRIGDTPVIGAGTFADDRACAVSCTGSGEFFLRESVAREIAARIRLVGETPERAAATVLTGVRAMGGTGGVIVCPASGHPVWHFNSLGMYRGTVSATLREVAIYGDEG